MCDARQLTTHPRDSLTFYILLSIIHSSIFPFANQCYFHSALVWHLIMPELREGWPNSSSLYPETWIVFTCYLFGNNIVRIHLLAAILHMSVTTKLFLTEYLLSLVISRAKLLRVSRQTREWCLKLLAACGKLFPTRFSSKNLTPADVTHSHLQMKNSNN
jgi:hypothetical protein